MGLASARMSLSQTSSRAGMEQLAVHDAPGAADGIACAHLVDAVLRGCRSPDWKGASPLLKQNASLGNHATRTPTTQTNHFVAALWTFTKLEMLKMRTKKNHYALKTQLYLSALQQAFESLHHHVQMRNMR